MTGARCPQALPGDTTSGLGRGPRASARQLDPSLPGTEDLRLHSFSGLFWFGLERGQDRA